MGTHNYYSEIKKDQSVYFNVTAASLNLSSPVPELNSNKPSDKNENSPTETPPAA